MPFATGDIVASGYPAAHVFSLGRDRNGNLARVPVKHLLWGDWVRVSDYDFVGSPEAQALTPPLAPAETGAARALVAGMVPVRVRGVSGYMDAADLQAEKLLEIVFVDVGQGDGALLVTPDDRKFVIDAGIGDNMHRYLRWRFGDFVAAQDDFDGFVITHPDQDHYNGFLALVENPNLRAGAIYHNGLVEQFGIAPDGSQTDRADERLGARIAAGGQDFLTDLIADDAGLAAFLAAPRRWKKDTTGRAKTYPALLHAAQTAVDAAGQRRFPTIGMLAASPGGQRFLPGFAPGAGSLEIEVLGPVAEPGPGGTPSLRTFAGEPRERTTAMDPGKTKNGHSVVLQIRYRDLTITLGGDLNKPAETFLLAHYSGLPVLGANKASDAAIMTAARPRLRADIVKSCHHGSADFSDLFLAATDAVATVVSSGDEESHAHPRSDTLGAIGRFGRGARPLVFSTELAHSTREFTRREDTPWYRAAKLEGEAANEANPVARAALLARAQAEFEIARTRNVTVYGAINLRSDGRRAVMAYKLEQGSAARGWDVYTLEPDASGNFEYVDVKEAARREAARRGGG